MLLSFEMFPCTWFFIVAAGVPGLGANLEMFMLSISSSLTRFTVSLNCSVVSPG